MHAYIAQIRMNLRLTFRDRSVLFFNYFFPLIFFFIFGQLLHADQGGVIVLVVTMVLTLGILGVRPVRRRHAHRNRSRAEHPPPIQSRAHYPGDDTVASMVTAFVHYIPVTFMILLLARTFYGIPGPASIFAVSFRVDRRHGLPRHRRHRRVGSQLHAGKPDHHPAFVFPMLFFGGATSPSASCPRGCNSSPIHPHHLSLHWN